MNRLVLTDLRLEQFRKFARPVRLAGLGPGLNLLCAPNEAGKSTLKAALDAAFFTRHGTSSRAIDAMRNQGNDAPPVVQVTFSLDGQPYALTKRFHRQKRARLIRPDGTHADNDPAEEQVEALLGFERVKGKGSPAEALGVWGLLWVAQGESFVAPVVSGSARESLEECLAGGGVAAITGGARGHRVTERVRLELAKYVTAGRGHPTGRYAQVLQEEKDAQADLNAANTLKADLGEQLRGLEASRRDRDAEERGVDPAAEEKEIQTLRRQLAEAQRVASQAETAEVNLRLAKSSLATAEQAADRRQELKARVQSAALAMENAAAEHTVKVDAVKAALADLAAAEEAFTQADEAWKLAGRVHQAITLRSKRQQQKDAAAAKAARLEQALASARESVTSAEAARALPANDAALRKLRALAGKRDEAAAARTAAATVLRFSLTAEGISALHLNGEAVPGSGEVALTRPAELHLGELGKIEIRPGVQDAAAIDQALADAEQAVANALDALQCASLAEVEAQAERRRQLQQMAASAKERARAYAPDLEGNAGQITEALETVKVAIAAADEALPMAASPEGDAVSEEDAAAAVRQAEQVRQDRYDHRARARQVHALAEQSARQAGIALEAVRGTHAAAAQALNTARVSVSDDLLVGQIADAKNALAGAERQRAEALEKMKSTGEPVRIDDQIKRLERGREQRSKRIALLRETIASLEAEVRAKAERGPDEAIRNAEERLARLTIERQRIERDVAALQLLDRTLRAAQSRVEARYLTPVTAKLRPHLWSLFGEAEVAMAGDFSLQSLSRENLTEDIGQLSAGTQEQLAILSRLAFADVLAEQGRPVVLLLDDALVYADDRRIQDMFGALERAAERFQVIVLTCRQRVFDGLGGENQRRLSIEDCEPIDL